MPVGVVVVCLLPRGRANGSDPRLASSEGSGASGRGTLSSGGNTSVSVGEIGLPLVRGLSTVLGRGAGDAGVDGGES